MVLVASALCGVIGLARRRGTHTKARRHEETEGGRRWGALRVKPPTHRRRGAHTKARRHEETEARIGLGSGFHYFIFIGAAFTPYGKQ